MGENVQPPDYHVPAVDKALRILKSLALAPDSLTLADLSSHLALPKSTVHSILTTLAQHQFARRDGDGRWALGLATFEVGSAYAARMDLVTAFRSVAAPMAAACGQPIQLGVLDGREIVYVAKVDGTEPVRLVSQEGTRLPAHTTALGKAILAFLPSQDFERLYAGQQLAARTPYSIVSIQGLRAEMERIRHQGFAYDNEETALGLHCVAAPIPTPALPAAAAQVGPPAAAVSFAIPSHRMSQARFSEIRDLAIRTAREITTRAGFRPGALVESSGGPA